jgi:plasmid maintenance system antidote protein VapI
MFMFMIMHILTKTGITRRHLQYLLKAERSAAPATAKKLERATGIAKELWIFGTAKQRQAAWKKFKATQVRLSR